MNEIVMFDEIKRMRKNDNSCVINWIDEKQRLLYVKVKGEEYEGLTPEETIEKFGTNYNLIQEFRYMLQNKEDIDAEKILKDSQSMKRQVISIFETIFINTIDIWESLVNGNKATLYTMMFKLKRNIDALYIVDESYVENVAGWYNSKSKNIYIKSKEPQRLKELINSGNIEEIPGEDLEKIIHECIHAISPDGVQLIDEEEDIVYGTAINEGIVQFITGEVIYRIIPRYGRIFYQLQR